MELITLVFCIAVGLVALGILFYPWWWSWQMLQEARALRKGAVTLIIAIRELQGILRRSTISREPKQGVPPAKGEKA